MTMLHAVRVNPAANRFFVSNACHPQTLDVVRTRAVPQGIEVVIDDAASSIPTRPTSARCSISRHHGAIIDYTKFIQSVHQVGGKVAMATDLLALTLLKPPGEFGADVAIGSAQRFGVPLGYGGPHAAFFATKDELKRHMPGRLIGVSHDAQGKPAMRLALQTREQHIRRDKATSNICTAQVLLAVMASMYAVTTVVHDKYFDTVLARIPGRADEVIAAAKANNINLWRVDDDHVSVTCDEVTTDAHVAAVLDAFGITAEPGAAGADIGLNRTSDFLTHPAFIKYRTETSMMRYLRALADKDLALDRSMIPLGSCTMKLNAAAEMESITWPEFARQHPFAPASDSQGLRRLIADSGDLAGADDRLRRGVAATQRRIAGRVRRPAGHPRLPRQPRRTAARRLPDPVQRARHQRRVRRAGRYAGGRGGLPVQRRRRPRRPARQGHEHADRLSTLMITYPSTHGVYEQDIADICAAVHDAGGQVYIDGANLNALVGLARPGKFGGDVSHLNLHKTFCIPHGGGGPGVGPVAVRSHLASSCPAIRWRPSCRPVRRCRRRPTGRRRSCRSAGPTSG
jgi:glycine dehydrogenase